MEIDRATKEQVYRVALKMRARDFEEFIAVSPLDDIESLAAALAERYGDRDDVLCGSLDGEPICIGGTIEAWPGVINLLFFATDDFPKIGLSITRFIRKELFPRYFEAGIHRIQAISLDGYEQVHAWLRAIGLQRETEPMPGYGKNGEAYIQFAKVRHASTSGLGK